MRNVPPGENHPPRKDRYVYNNLLNTLCIKDNPGLYENIKKEDTKLRKAIPPILSLSYKRASYPPYPIFKKEDIKQYTFQ